MCSAELSAPGAPVLVDTHCHTEYAYCATDVSARENVRLSRGRGLDGVCLLEHTFQLYFDREEAWSFRWQTDPSMVARSWTAGRGRMDDYRRFVTRVRDENATVWLGLEVDLCAGGGVLLAGEDRGGWDVLAGAVHQIPDFDRQMRSQAGAERLFLGEVERLLAAPIQVLAHPFRFLRHAGMDCPPSLGQTVAGWLAQAGVAAELNFHNNEPDPAFFEGCLTRGVRIALATDAHALDEVGVLDPHLALLRRLGVDEGDWPHVLYVPPVRPAGRRE